MKTAKSCQGGDSSSSSSSTNPFERLPNEVFILILENLPNGNDLKFLTQLSLVSHQFASAILHVPKVELTIPALPPDFWSKYRDDDTNTNDNDTDSDADNNTDDTDNNTDDIETDFWLKYQVETERLKSIRSQVKLSYEKTNNLLRKFVDLHSLHVKFSDPDELRFWDMCINEDRIDTELYADDTEAIAHLRKCSNIYIFEFKSPIFHMGLALWHDLLAMLVHDHPMLQSVRFKSPKSGHKICLGIEELTEYKSIIEWSDLWRSN